MTTSHPFECLSSRLKHDSPLVRVCDERVRAQSGSEHDFTTIRFKVCGVAVLPIDAAGRTRLVGQHRYVSDRFTWELVRGAGDLADPLGAAQRELSEETGMSAAHWLAMSTLMASPGLSDEMAPCFLAWNTEEGEQHPDEGEDLRVRRVTLAETVDMVLSGEIWDAASSALILMTWLRAQRGDLPGDVLDLVGPQLR